MPHVATLDPTSSSHLEGKMISNNSAKSAETVDGTSARRARANEDGAQIWCCEWVDYPTPGHDTACVPCGSTFTTGAESAPETSTLDELRALADTADDTAESLWTAYRAAAADLEEQRQQLDALAERAEQASQSAARTRGHLRAELRAAGYMMTATGYTPRPVPMTGALA